MVIMLKLIKNIFFETIPVLIMIGLIPVVKNDYLLSLLYVVIILISFKIKYIKNEHKVFIGGFIFMVLSEFIFVSTGVETFVRNTLFNLMPLWLPFLWGYGFVVIRRVSEYLIK